MICLHPPGADAEPYYQVAMSRTESGAVIVPHLPLRRHPGVALLRRALADQALGTDRGLRHELPADPEVGDLVRHVFPRMVDVVRALLGEIEALTATGDRPGDRPEHSFVVQLRGATGRRAEVRAWTGHREHARLVALGSEGTQTLEYDPELVGPSRMVVSRRTGGEQVIELEPWDPHAATLDALADAIAGHEAHPDLGDGTRAMELAEAAVRSLRRERTIELHFGTVSEAGHFKSVMTSVGCLLLVAILIILPAALVGPALGHGWTIYIAYLILPVLIVFFVAKTLHLAVREPSETRGDDGPIRR